MVSNAWLGVIGDDDVWRPYEHEITKIHARFNVLSRHRSDFAMQSKKDYYENRHASKGLMGEE